MRPVTSSPWGVLPCPCDRLILVPLISPNFHLNFSFSHLAHILTSQPHQPTNNTSNHVHHSNLRYRQCHCCHLWHRRLPAPDHRRRLRRPTHQQHGLRLRRVLQRRRTGQVQQRLWYLLSRAGPDCLRARGLPDEQIKQLRWCFLQRQQAQRYRYRGGYYHQGYFYEYLWNFDFDLDLDECCCGEHTCVKDRIGGCCYALLLDAYGCSCLSAQYDNEPNGMARGTAALLGSEVNMVSMCRAARWECLSCTSNEYHF